jgi:hypothetical protein
MRWILPGGAVLVESGRKSTEPVVACRSGAAVLVRTIRRKAKTPEPPKETVPEPRVESVPEPSRANPMAPTQPQPDQHGSKLPERLATLKLFLEVLVIFIGLIGAILALFGLSRK